MTPPDVRWPKHPRTPEQIWEAANNVEKPAGDYENLSSNVWTQHGRAKEGVAGTIAGPLDEIPKPVLRDALDLIQAAIVGAAATRQFGDAVLIFDQEVDEIHNQYENAKAHNFYVSDGYIPSAPGPQPNVDAREDLRRDVLISHLDKRYRVLEDDLDDEAAEKKQMLEKDPTKADLLKWMKAGTLPPAAAAAFPKYDFTGVPEFQAWKRGYEFPQGGRDRRTWATFFGPGAPGSEAVVTQAGEPGPDRGIIYGRFFISSHTAMGIPLMGDNRGFTSDPDAGHRMAFAYNTATGELSFTSSPSTRHNGDTLPADDLAHSHAPWTSAYPKVETLPDGRIKINIHGVNPLTPAGAVDTDVTIDPDENVARVHGDDYPDVEIYRQNPDGSTETIGRDEAAWADAGAVLPPFPDRDETFGYDPEPSPSPQPSPTPVPTPDPGQPTPDPQPTPSPSPGPSPQPPQGPPPGYPDWHDR